VELGDIEKQYMLVHARLQLLHTLAEPAHMAAPQPTPSETVALLINAGMFDSAINMCKVFALSLAIVFEGLAARYATRSFLALVVIYLFILIVARAIRRLLTGRPADVK